MPSGKKARLSDDATAAAASESGDSEAAIPFIDGDAVGDEAVNDAGCLSEANAEDDSNDGAGDADERPRKRVAPTPGAVAAAPRSGLREVDVGITEYASQLEAIGGVLKQRYADFVVNEIALSGEVVHLTSTDDVERPNAAAKSHEDDPTTISDLFSPQDLQLMKELHQSSDVNAQAKITASADKAVRTQQHGYIRLHFPTLRSSYEQEGEQRKYLVITKVGGNKSRNADHDRWPKDRPKYLHFVLYKEFKDTMEAIDVISKYAGLRPHVFTYVGTKDKRARTTQQVAVHRVEASRLRRVNDRLQNMAVGNFSYKDQPLQLGELLGNRFGIVLRQVAASDGAISKAMEHLRSRGFINYFGMQRFGTSTVPTHDVGKRLLRGDFAGAVDLILGDRPGERPSVAAARRVWSATGDPRAMLAVLPRCCAVERRLADGLIEQQCCGRGAASSARQGQDEASSSGTQPPEQPPPPPELSRNEQERWRRALESLPRGTRQIYVHSYQSYVWNRVASRRIREFGFEPVIGDLVALRPAASGCDSGLAGQGVPARTGDSPEDKVSKWNVKLLQSADELVKYSVYDVCLPLPGHDVVYPGNEVKDWYEKILQEDEMTFDCFRSKSKDYSLPGSYRMLMAKPGDLSWRTCRYDDPNVPLIQSDLDRLSGIALSNSGGQHTALVMEFSLPTSSYATMALREVLRADTSSGHQSTLNHAKELPPVPSNG